MAGTNAGGPGTRGRFPQEHNAGRQLVTMPQHKVGVMHKRLGLFGLAVEDSNTCTTQRTYS